MTSLRVNSFMQLACACLLLAGRSGEAFSLLPRRGLAPSGTFTSSLSLSSTKRDNNEKVKLHVSPAWRVPPTLAKKWVGAAALGASLAISALASGPFPALAESPRVVGQLQGSGLVFKDTLQIESFDDPKVQGVTLYISNFQRPITERLTSNFLQDPSYASVACAKTGPIKVADNIATGTSGEEVFEESRSLLFKTLRVQRIYDAQKKAVVYVSFNTRLDKSDDSNKSRFKSSLCAVSLE